MQSTSNVGSTTLSPAELEELDKLQLELSKLTDERDDLNSLIEQGRGAHHSQLEKRYQAILEKIAAVEKKISHLLSTSTLDLSVSSSSKKSMMISGPASSSDLALTSSISYHQHLQSKVESKGALSMTHPRTFPATGHNSHPTIGQGFTTLTEALLEKVVSKEPIEDKPHDYAGAVEVHEINTEQMRTNQSSLGLSLGAHAAFVLSVLGEFSQHQEETGQAVESFLVMMMPLRTDTVDLPKLRATLPDFKVTPPENFFSRSGDSYVKSITYGNYLLASMTSVKGEQKKGRSGGGSIGGTEPTTGLGGKLKGQASQERTLLFSKDQKLIRSSRPEFLIPKEGGGYDLDKIKEKFREDAEKYRHGLDKRAHPLSAMTFEVSDYDKREGDHDTYILSLKACHDDMADGLYYTERYLKALRFFDETLADWKAEGAKPEEVAQEREAAAASKSSLAKAKEKLLGHRKELEKKEAPTPARLEEIRQHVRDETISLITKKEKLKKTAARRLVGVVTLKSADDKYVFSEALISKLNMLQQKGIDHLYIALEGTDAKETMVTVYHKRFVVKDDPCLSIEGTETFLPIGYLTAIKDLYLGINRKEKDRQWHDIIIKFYAVHPYYDTAIASKIAITETPYFEKTVRPKLLASPQGLQPDGPMAEEKLVRCEHRWRAALMARELTKTLPKRLPYFVARQEFKALEKGFEGEGNSSVQVIIHGMGGVGKTQLATEYAHAVQAQFGFVCWVHADPKTLGEEWEALAKRLGLELKGIEESSQRRLVREALSEQPSWLLVLDNLESEEALIGLLPEKLTAKQQVLVTSRSEHWGTRVKTVSLSLFTTEQAEVFFKDRLTAQHEKLRKGTEALAQELSYLPLALSHAVAYMQQHSIDGETYLKRYKEKGIDIFGTDLMGRDLRTESTEVEYQKTVLTTWVLSIEQLEKKNEKAAQLVKLCGYLHPDCIPEAILKKALEFKDDTELDSCMHTIKEYALLSRETDGIKIHRLLQGAIRHQEEKLPQVEQFTKHLQPLAKALSELYPDFYSKSSEEWELAQKLEPHIQALSQALKPFIKSAELKLEERQKAAALQLRLLLMLANIYRTSVNFEVSKGYCEQALQLAEEWYGKKHLETAVALVSMGEAEYDLGEYKKAESHYLNSLAIRNKQGDKESSNIAALYNKLGCTYETLGDAKKALEYYEKTRVIYLKIYGEEYPEVAGSYRNLGSAHNALGDARKALEYYEKAREIYLRTYDDEEHSEVAKTYSNLGNIHEVLGHTGKALEWHKKALTIKLKIHHEKHPSVAASYNDLANTYQALGDVRTAREYHEKALAIKLKVYGDEHPSVAASYNNLANAHRDLGDAKEALRYQEKDIAISLKVYGEESPAVAVGYGNLGRTYRALGDVKEALKWHTKALNIKLKIYAYDPKHPAIAVSYSELGNAHLALGDANEALKYQNMALDILKNYGEKSPAVAAIYSNLGSAYKALGNAEEALKCYKNDLAISIKMYGEKNPSVANAYKTLGETHETLGNTLEAIQFYQKALEVYKHLGEKEKMEGVKSHIERLAVLVTIPSVSDRELHPAVPTPLLSVTDVQPQFAMPRPIAPDTKQQPDSSAFSSYFSFFRNNPGKTALAVCSVVALGSLAYAYLKKPGVRK